MSDVSNCPGRGRPGMDALVEHPPQTTCDIGMLACCIQEALPADLQPDAALSLRLPGKRTPVRMPGRRSERAAASSSTYGESHRFRRCSAFVFLSMSCRRLLKFLPLQALRVWTGTILTWT